VHINEIASAEEQVELWKLVSSSVWQSLQQQQREEQRLKAEAAAKKGAAPKGRKGVRSAPRIPNPTPNKPPTKTAHPNAKQTLPPAIKPVPSATLPTAPAQPNALQQSASALPKPPYSVKSAGKWDKYALQKTDDETDDRHSKNTFLPAVPNSVRR
jgi:hypothetical protein